jgi:hypothetical protein
MDGVIQFSWSTDYTSSFYVITVRPTHILNLIEIMKRNFSGLVPGIERKLDEIYEHAVGLRTPTNQGG